MRKACSASAIESVDEVGDRPRRSSSPRAPRRSGCSRSMRSKKAAAALPTSYSSCCRRRASACCLRSASDAVFDDLDTHTSRQLPDRLHERQPGNFLKELDGVAGRAATEAMIEAALLVDVEAGRLFLVEWAEPDVAAAALLELHALADKRNDPRLLSDTVDGLLPDHSKLGIPQNEREPRRDSPDFCLDSGPFVARARARSRPVPATFRPSRSPRY